MDCLIVFIKNIQPGKVKTRLAATVGNERAVEIYRALLERTRKAALGVEAKRFVFYSSFIEENDDWGAAHFSKKTQQGADIGERMHHALEAVLKTSEKAILVGGDIAGLTAEILGEALKKLDDHDTVIGPAIDGGYYLIGLKKAEPSIFQNIEWSSPNTRKMTVEKIKALGLTCHFLPELSDIDYEEDWVKYGWEIK